MKLNLAANYEMKNNRTKRLFLSALIAGGAIFQASCSTSGSEAWAKIQSEGLIPYLAEHQSARKENGAVAAQRREVPRAKLRPAPERTETPIFTAGVVTAKAVDGKPGFVYSPHTDTALMVDVTDFQVGARVRCPYTKKSFIIPGTPIFAPLHPSLPRSLVASTPPVRRPLPTPVRTPQMQVVSEPQPKKDTAARDEITLVKPKEEETFEKMAVVEDLPIDEPIISQFPKDKKPPTSEPLALSQKVVVEEVPVGKRVPGQPNYVYSPFASSNQVVDVEGHAAGTKVKCPYTGKVFSVPAAE